MKIRLQTKFVILFLIYSGILFLLQYLLIVYVGVSVYQQRCEDYLTKLEDIAIRELEMTPEELIRYGETQKTDARYLEILSHMKQLQELSGTACFYVIYPTSEEEAIWLFDTAEDGQVLGDVVIDYMDPESEAFRNTYIFNQKQSYVTRYDENSDENVISVFSPLRDTEGRAIAVMGVDVFLNDIVRDLADEILHVGKYLLGLTVMGMLLLLLFVRFGIVRSIRRLEHGVQKMMDGEPGTEIPCRRRDEIGEITRTFNRMSVVIKEHMSKMGELNRAYQKFVPGETLKMLHKDSVVDVALADQARERMAVLSMEAYDFDKATQKLSSEETFLYINDMLETMVPVVIEHGGVIMQFENAGMCSFYQKRTEEALLSALQICERSREKAFAAGIAEGMVMVGVAGHSERMNIISISEEKKLSKLLMQLAPRYQASILISRNVREQIPDFAESYHARFLGYIRLSRQLIGIYDVFDGDKLEDRQFKQMTKEQFEQGVALFGAGNYLEARQTFVGVLRQYRRDEAAKAYIHRCSQLLQNVEEVPEVWLEAF